MADILPVAQLMSYLGLDASGLTEGLAQSSVSLNAFEKEANASLAMAGVYFKQVIPPALALNAVLEVLEKSGLSTRESFNQLGVSISGISAAMAKETAEAKALAQELTRASLQQEVFNRSKAMGLGLPANLRDDAGRFRKRDMEELEEYNQSLNLIEADRIESEKFYAAEEAEIQQARLAARAEYVAATKALMASLVAGGEDSGAAGGGGGARAGVGFRVGSSGINPFFRLTQGISATVAPLMDIIFPIAMIGIAVELMGRYMDSIQGVAVALSGAADKSKELAEATTHMLTAIEKQADDMTRIDAMAKREGVSSATVRARIGAVDTPATRLLQAQIAPMADERNNLTAIIDQLKSVPTTFGRNMAAQLMGTKLGMTGAQDFTAEGIVKKRDELDAKINELTNHKVRIQEEEVNSMEKHVKALKKYHDQVHEYSNRAPGFAGGGLAHDGILISGSFGPAPSSAVHTGGSIPAPMSRIQSGGDNSQPTSPSRAPAFKSSSGGNSGGASVTIQNHYTFNYSGVPDFMRDIIEPKMVKDMENNSRGLAKQMTDALAKQGVVVR